ncbi:hypothetical protein GCM10011390_47790 [Aureimonas endophytica]|uniref:Uncharacterized protein n=1 Tax=Aureimonas endophytica TaxID=2027858 RepID=A0A917A282_9HYPH|nr:hypothetical protein GCM10011390_47790 [Aureimonas endophytica]
MAMDDVEPVQPLAQILQPRRFQDGRDRGRHRAVLGLQRGEAWQVSHKSHICRTVRSGEQRYFDSESSKGDREVVNDPLGSAMVFRRDRKYRWGNLSDTKLGCSFGHLRSGFRFGD